MVVSSDGELALTLSLKDFKDAKITAQQGVYLYNFDLTKSRDVSKQTAMGDF